VTRRRRLRLTAAEAERIRAQDRAGRLAKDDPEVRRIVEEANRASVRAHVYGRDRQARRQSVLVVVVVVLAAVLFTVGLAVAVLLEHW
jgi:hypothetical protein